LCVGGSLSALMIAIRFMEDCGLALQVCWLSERSLLAMTPGQIAELVQNVDRPAIGGVLIQFPRYSVRSGHSGRYGRPKRALSSGPRRDVILRTRQYPGGVPHLSSSLARRVRSENLMLDRIHLIFVAVDQSSQFLLAFGEGSTQQQGMSVWASSSGKSIQAAASVTGRLMLAGCPWRFAGSASLTDLPEPLPRLSGVLGAPSVKIESVWELIGPVMRDHFLPLEVVPVEDSPELAVLAMVSSGISQVLVTDVKRERPVPRGGKRDARFGSVRSQKFRKRRPPPAGPWTEEVGRWKLLWRGKWKITEHTNINELRTIAMLCRRLSLDHRRWNTRVLVFSDSTSAIGAVSKGRSSRPALLRLTRQIAAISIALGIRMICRYVRSEKNWSDGPSRGGPVGVAEGTRMAHAERDLGLLAASRSVAGL
jgi:hypothetical protein